MTRGAATKKKNKKQLEEQHTDRGDVIKNASVVVNSPCKKLVQQTHQLLGRALIREACETANVRKENAAKKTQR